MEYDHQSKINEPQIHGQRILVVDDDDQLQGLLSSALSLFGLSVSLANNGGEGMREFRYRPFDLVLTDLKMPGIDGMNLAYYIKALSPRKPVVLMTGCGREEVTEMRWETLVDHILFKPFHLTELMQVITNLLLP